MKKQKVYITQYGTIIDLVPAVDWHFGFSFRNWCIGASFEKSMWQFDFLWFYIWCDRYSEHGETLNEIPDGAEVISAVRPVSEFNERPA